MLRLPGGWLPDASLDIKGLEMGSREGMRPLVTKRVGQVTGTSA